jgi:hypothetical protein
MLGILLSLVVSAPSAMPSAGVTCPDEPETCDGALVAIAALAREETDDDGPSDYATPAEIDCPAPGDGPIASPECDDMPLDLWYRVSRSPESEQPNGALAPAPRRTRPTRASSCGGGPADPGHLAAPDVQPIALFALPALLPEGARGHLPGGPQMLPSRALAPPDRPPRT